MRAPTRALVVEDIESWAYTLSRAARRAGASEIQTCSDLGSLQAALRKERFDVAIIDIGLDPDDDTDAGGVQALEMIREIDGPGTRCVLMTGWQGGDRMDLQAELTRRHGVEWAYMKEKYDALVVVAKLTELLENATERRVGAATPMANLAALADPMPFEGALLRSLSVKDGVTTLYSLTAGLLSPVVPLVAKYPNAPLSLSDGAPSAAGMYWSRALGTAVAVELASAAPRVEDHEELKASIAGRFDLVRPPEMLAQANRRNLRGRLWELPGVERDVFPG